MIDCPIKLTTNTARHIWASRAAELNIPLTIIRDGLNHKYAATTEHYLDSINNNKLNEVNDQITKF